MELHIILMDMVSAIICQVAYMKTAKQILVLSFYIMKKLTSNNNYDNI